MADIIYNNLRKVLNVLKKEIPHQREFFTLSAIGKSIGKARATLSNYALNKAQPSNEVADQIVKYIQKFDPALQKDNIFSIKPLNYKK